MLKLCLIEFSAYNLENQHCCFWAVFYAKKASFKLGIILIITMRTLNHQFQWCTDISYGWASTNDVGQSRYRGSLRNMTWLGGLDFEWSLVYEKAIRRTGGGICSTLTTNEIAFEGIFGFIPSKSGQVLRRIITMDETYFTIIYWRQNYFLFLRGSNFETIAQTNFHFEELH